MIIAEKLLDMAWGLKANIYAINVRTIMSPYEKDLYEDYNRRLKIHLSKPKVQKRLEKTGLVGKEILKFAKRYDKKYFTDFYDVLIALRDSDKISNGEIKLR